MSERVLLDEKHPEIQLVPFELRRHDRSLREAYLGWLNDMEVVLPIAAPGLLKTKGPEFIEESFARFTHPQSQGFFIFFEPDRIFIGTTKLDSISLHCRSAWDGIMIGDRRYHGRGFASRVYRVLLAYAFGNLGLNRVSGGCNANNLPMVRTFQRLGYTLEGRLRQADFIDTEFSDHLYFGILRDEFFAENSVNLRQTLG